MLPRERERVREQRLCTQKAFARLTLVWPSSAQTKTAMCKFHFSKWKWCAFRNKRMNFNILPTCLHTRFRSLSLNGSSYTLSLSVSNSRSCWSVFILIFVFDECFHLRFLWIMIKSYFCGRRAFEYKPIISHCHCCWLLPLMMMFFAQCLLHQPDGPNLSPCSICAALTLLLLLLLLLLSHLRWWYLFSLVHFMD